LIIKSPNPLIKSSARPLSRSALSATCLLTLSVRFLCLQPHPQVGHFRMKWVGVDSSNSNTSLHSKQVLRILNPRNGFFHIACTQRWDTRGQGLASCSCTYTHRTHRPSSLRAPSDTLDRCSCSPSLVILPPHYVRREREEWQLQPPLRHSYMTRRDHIPWLPQSTRTQDWRT